jgi:hypothetical protein
MYLKTDSLGRNEIMDGDPDNARNDPDAKTVRKNPIVDIYVAKMRAGDLNAQAGFAHYAKVYRQQLLARANAGDQSAKNEIAILDRSLPLATKIDTSLLGDNDPEWLVTAHLTNSRQDIIDLYDALKMQKNTKRLIAIQTAARNGDKAAILLLRRITEGPPIY